MALECRSEPFMGRHLVTPVDANLEGWQLQLSANGSPMQVDKFVGTPGHGYKDQVWMIQSINGCEFPVTSRDASGYMNSMYTKNFSRFLAPPLYPQKLKLEQNFDLLEVGIGYSTALLQVLDFHPSIQAIALEPHDYEIAAGIFEWSLANLDLPQETIDRICHYQETRERIRNHTRLNIFPLTLKEFVEAGAFSMFDGVICVAGPNGYPETEKESQDTINSQLDNLLAPGGFRI